MRNRWITAAILALAIPLVCAAELPAGAIAPPFSLMNVDGKMVSLSDFANSKGTVVIFSCNSCPFAKAYQDRIIQLYNDYQPKGIAMVVISSNDSTIRPDDSYGNLQKRAADKHYPFPYLYDQTQTVARAYGATNTPHAFVFDANHKLVYRGKIDDNAYEDKVTKHQVREVLDLLLAGTPDKIETATTKPIGCTIKWRAT